MNKNHFNCRNVPVSFLIVAVLVVGLCCSAQCAVLVRVRDGTGHLESSKLLVTVESDRAGNGGFITVRDKQARHDWVQLGGMKHYPFTGLAPVRDGLRFSTKLDQFWYDEKGQWHWGEALPCTVTLRIPEQNPRQLHITCDMPAEMPFHGLHFLEPFAPPVSANPEDSVLAITDWNSGRLYPTNLEKWPCHWIEYYPVNMLQMPWVGVCDIATGLGYSVTVDTPYDANVRPLDFDPGPGIRRAPLIHWLPQLGKWGYQRRIIYTFTPNGGYVGLAKSFRRYLIDNPYGASPNGVVTFKKKSAANPNIRKLYGAAYIADYYHYVDAVEAHTLGVTRAFQEVTPGWDCRHNSISEGGKNGGHWAKTTVALGWLAAEYDTFIDAYIVPEESQVGYLYETVDKIMKDARQKIVPGWVDHHGQQYQVCSSVYMSHARRRFTDRLSKIACNARYLDVHAQRQLVECWDPKHSKTRTQFLQDTLELMDFEHNRLSVDGKPWPLVMSAECGKWWSVPYQDFSYGLLSILALPWKEAPTKYGQEGDSSLFSWQTYENWGSVSHKYRAPLWQLVFHDCIVDTFRPDNDSTDVTTRAELADTNWPWSYQKKKDAIAVLYGGVASFRNVYADGSWHLGDEARCRFLTSYRNTCKPQEVLAEAEMVRHEFLTPSRDVQKTIWSDGTEIVANFGSSDHTLKVKGKTYTLPQFGFVIDGPKVRESLVLVNGKNMTTIKMDGYYFSDSQGVPVAVRRVSPTLLRVNADYNGKGSLTFTIRPLEVVRTWDFARTKVWRCDTKTGMRIEEISWERDGDGIRVGPFNDWTVLDVEAL